MPPTRYACRLLMIAGVLACGTLSGCQTPLYLGPAPVTGDVLALQEEAYAAYARADWPAAELAYRDLTRRLPQDAEPWFRLGNVYVHQDQPDRALAAYREALERDPNNGKAWHNMGVVQLRLATDSFLILEQLTAPDDPLRERAEQMLNMVGRLLEDGFDAAVEDEIDQGAPQ